MDCSRTVPLDLSAYAELRERGGSVLAPGHSVSRAERARRSARELRDAAEALAAQAELQKSRARKNTPPAEK
ncbi:MAG: hypothetical protein JO064_08365 [Actinobacteria bacterium]|nr:hypothetical protein [Actinomycetota bacterium]MBV8396256.1 hypothetical protein [Actinomycetota bacterium]